MGTDPRNEIESVMRDWLAAAKAGDSDRLRNHYAEDIVSFDAVMQLQFKGRDAYMKHWEVSFENCPGPLHFELSDTAVEANDALGFSRSLLQCGYTDDDGNEHLAWMRVTACYRKVAGRWVIAHEHFSAPFDPENGKAKLDATP